MRAAKHANKSIVKYFGKQLEEFRTEQSYNREIVLCDRDTQEMERHFELSLNRKKV